MNPDNNVAKTGIYIGSGSPSRKVSHSHPVISAWRSEGYTKENAWKSDVAFIVSEYDLTLEKHQIIPMSYIKVMK